MLLGRSYGTMYMVTDGSHVHGTNAYRGQSWEPGWLKGGKKYG